MMIMTTAVKRVWREFPLNLYTCSVMRGVLTRLPGSRETEIKTKRGECERYVDRKTCSSKTDEGEKHSVELRCVGLYYTMKTVIVASLQYVRLEWRYKTNLRVILPLNKVG